MTRGTKLLLTMPNGSMVLSLTVALSPMMGGMSRDRFSNYLNIAYKTILNTSGIS
jgi:hypothetical protein